MLIIIVGPSRCGKTRNADRFMKHFKCKEIVDGGTLPVGCLYSEKHRTLYLTNDISIEQTLKNLHGQLHFALLTFDMAMEFSEALPTTRGVRPILSFDTLRAANVARLPTFKNKHGEPAHLTIDGSDWSLSEWVNATAGEAGELAELILMAAITKSLGTVGNMTKKIQRGDLSLMESREAIGKELADVVTYCDLLAFRAEIDLGVAVLTKFNEVSARVKSPVFIDILEK